MYQSDSEITIVMIMIGLSMFIFCGRVRPPFFVLSLPICLQLLCCTSMWCAFPYCSQTCMVLALGQERMAGHVVLLDIRDMRCFSAKEYASKALRVRNRFG